MQGALLLIFTALSIVIMEAAGVDVGSIPTPLCGWTRMEQRPG